MSDPVCPYCRMPFDEASPPRVFCTACGMPHHEDCYRENGGCTVFGCKCAPADDPKLQVSQSDLRAVQVPVQPYAPAPQQYAPAPQYPRTPYGGPLGLSQAAAPAPAQVPGQRQLRRPHRLTRTRSSQRLLDISMFLPQLTDGRKRAGRLTLFLVSFLAPWGSTTFIAVISAARWANCALPC